jgi:ligand-binding SRPBCC domain-containing protein
MPTIHLTTFIAAPAERVFDLSRSIDLHKKTMAKTQEQAVAGTTMGLINIHETVTWKAKHLGKMRFLKSKIVAMQKPESFVDVMLEGDFRSLQHEHYFKSIDNGTIMIDVLQFELPYGSVGKIANKLFLVRYMKKLLEQRNEMLKHYAETEKWKNVLIK